MTIRHSLTPLNSSWTMGTVRRRDDNSRGKVQNVCGGSSARFQRKQQPLSRHTVSALKGRDHDVATAAMAEGLEVTLYPYLIETCADETWQLEHFPTRREQAALGDQMDPTDLENALDIRASSEDVEDFEVVWVDPPPHFNAQPTMYPDIAEGRAHTADPDLPALTHLHA